MAEFSKAGATIKFIEMFNITFDILNSRSINCIGYKKTICKDNFMDIYNFTQSFTEYIKGFKIMDSNEFIPVLDSKGKLASLDL